MSKRFDANTVLCNEIFDQKSGIYEIPDFQRPYSWGKDEVNQLFQDLYEAWKETKRSYYLGPIILVEDHPKQQEKSDEKQKNKRLKIIDGQQRLTTLTILYSLFNYVFKDELMDGNKNIVKRRIYEEGLEGSTELEPYRLRLGDKWHTDFRKTVLEDVKLNEVNRFTKMADELKKKIETKFDNSEDLNSFFSFVDDKVELVKIQTTDFSDGIRVFLTINTRGKGLSLSDKVKSFLLEKTESKEERNDVVSDWRDIVDATDENFDKINSILQSYRQYLQEEKAEGTAYEELKSEFSSKGPTNIIRNFKRFAKCYLEVTENHSEIIEENKKRIFMLRKLRHDQWKTILTAAKMNDFEDFGGLLEELVAYYFSYWIAGHYSTMTENPSYKILKKIKNKDGLNEISDFIEKERKKDNIITKVRNNVNSKNVRDISPKKWPKRMLVVIEYTMATDRLVEEIQLTDKTHLEHILPNDYQAAMDDYQYWKKRFKGANPEELRNSIGNLVLLQYDINESTQNKPYNIKRKFFKGEKAPKGKEKKETCFKFTAKVADKFEDWNPENIHKNKKMVLEKYEEILNFPKNSLTQ